jgi:hypothetical protein
MRRRQFITAVAGAAAWPVMARAQQPGGRMRRIGVLIPFNADDPSVQQRMTPFVQGLQQLGWTEGRSSSRGSGARRLGRWRCGRSKAAGCGGSACSRRATKTISCGRLNVSAFTQALASSSQQGRRI